MLARPHIAITGNTGKTTIKELLALTLGQQMQVFKSFKNGNDPYFISKYSKQIKPEHEAVILEFGLQKTNDLKKCCDFFKANIGIITNIGLSHYGNFSNIEQIAQGKSELIKGMDQNGILFINHDDENSKLLETKDFEGVIKTISLEDSKADFYATDISSSPKGLSFRMSINHVSHQFDLNILGRHNAYNALFVIAVCLHLGVKPETIKNGFSQFKPVQSRLNVLNRDDVCIIDDSFNAGPESMISAIDVLADIGSGLKLAILGPMLCQGDKIICYKNVAKVMVEQQIDYIFTMNSEKHGSNARYYIDEAIKLGMDKKNTRHFDSINDLIMCLYSFKKYKVNMLFKGEDTYMPLNLLKRFWIEHHKRDLLHS